MISRELVDKFLEVTEEERINLSQKNDIDKKYICQVMRMSLKTIGF